MAAVDFACRREYSCQRLKASSRTSSLAALLCALWHHMIASPGPTSTACRRVGCVFSYAIFDCNARLYRAQAAARSDLQTAICSTPLLNRDALVFPKSRRSAFDFLIDFQARSSHRCHPKRPLRGQAAAFWVSIGATERVMTGRMPPSSGVPQRLSSGYKAQNPSAFGPRDGIRQRI
jgi:hypothetical protein